MIPLEAMLILAAILILYLLFFLLSFIDSMVLLTIGIMLIILGLLCGIPAGFYYHILLFKRRRLINQELKNWWLFPQRYHKYLPKRDQKILSRWFWIGAIFFDISLIGCGLVLISLFYL